MATFGQDQQHRSLDRFCREADVSASTFSVTLQLQGYLAKNSYAVPASGANTSLLQKCDTTLEQRMVDGRELLLLRV